MDEQSNVIFLIGYTKSVDFRIIEIEENEQIIGVVFRTYMNFPAVITVFQFQIARII